MAKIKGKNNNTIEGNGNHMIDTIENIEEVHIHNYDNSGNGDNTNKDDTNPEDNELEKFWEIGVQKTPGLDLLFYFTMCFLMLGIAYLQMKILLPIHFILLIGIILFAGIYYYYSELQNKISNLIYIKEDEVVVGQSSYTYEEIRVDDINVENGRIDFGFVNDTERLFLDMRHDAAGLLKHKIEEFHHLYNEQRKQ